MCRRNRLVSRTPQTELTNNLSMKAAANLSLLYGQLPLEERFAAARDHGFTAVEILFPYDQEPQWYARKLKDHGLQLVLVNTPSDPDTAPWGRAGLPGQEAAFRHDFARAAQVCRASGCGAVHVMAGCPPMGEREAGRQTLLANLQWAADTYPDLTLQLEALNQFDVPGYHYSKPAEVREILALAGVEQAGMQFDFYHTRRQGLDVVAELEASLPWIRHVQVAGSPARQEPDLARDISFLQGFRRLYESGYRGHVGFEYRPAGQVSEGLRWAQDLAPYFSQQPTA